MRSESPLLALIGLLSVLCVVMLAGATVAVLVGPEHAATSAADRQFDCRQVSAALEAVYDAGYDAGYKAGYDAGCEDTECDPYDSDPTAPQLVEGTFGGYGARMDR